MIKPLSSSNAALAAAQLGAVARTGAVKAATASRTEAAQATTAASTIAAAGAPVDVDKVSRIRAGIADGSYSADPQAIASAMVDTDLPGGA